MSLGSMIKKITANEKEQRVREQQLKTRENTGFSSLNVNSNEENFRSTEHLRTTDMKYKTSTFTTIGASSSSLYNKTSKPPLMPHQVEKTYKYKTNLDRTGPDMIDSQFITSKTSINDISDLEEHSGLKKLEKHLGT